MAVTLCAWGCSVSSQAVIDGNLLPAVMNLLENSEFDIRKEAAWCVSNLCAGGSPEQVLYAISLGGVKGLCSLLTTADARVQCVALEGLEVMLKVRVDHPLIRPLRALCLRWRGDVVLAQTGEDQQRREGLDSNRVSALVEECGGLDHIEALQSSESERAFDCTLGATSGRGGSCVVRLLSRHMALFVCAEVYERASSLLQRFFDAEAADGEIDQQGQNDEEEGDEPEDPNYQQNSNANAQQQGGFGMFAFGGNF